jgi:ankyrin repeat protein
VVEFLLKHDSKPDRRNELGRTLLSYAAQDSSLGVVKALLTLNNINIASRDNTNRTPLIYAVSTKNSMTSFSLHTDTAIALLDRMNVGQITRDNQEGILSEHAARLGRKELAILLKDTMGFYNNSLASL